jgi:hypothetical protein
MVLLELRLNESGPAEAADPQGHVFEATHFFPPVSQKSFVALKVGGFPL